jgi:hypothetical protein
MEAFYKIRHRPTGMFYKPTTYNNPSNLSKRGKVYHKRPTLKHLGDKYKYPGEAGCDWGWRRVIEDEWEIVQFDVSGPFSLNSSRVFAEGSGE